MPEVLDNLDNNRLDQVRRLCARGAQFWLDLLIAADNHDADECRRTWKRIRDVSVRASDLLKSLGAEQPK